MTDLTGARTTFIAYLAEHSPATWIGRTALMKHMLVRRWVRPAQGGRSDPAGKFEAFLGRSQSGQGRAARVDIPNRVNKPPMSETTITMVAAAIANAVYDATGARLRSARFGSQRRAY